MRSWLAAALVLICLGGLHSVRAQEEEPGAPEVKAQEEGLEAPERLAPRILEQPPSYDPTGKRDPFRPFTLDLQPPELPRGLVTPLQLYELRELSMVGVVWATHPARAMVEDNMGMGFIVTVGTPIGRNQGVVKSIEPDRIVVEERVLDFYGQEQVNEVVMELPKETTTKQSRRGRR